MDLGGIWRAAVADEGLRRAYPAPEFDDAGWAPIAVPSHWRSTAAFADTHGPLLYRRQFKAPDAGPRRWWLTLDGVFYDGDVWLDGSYIGATEGYFFPHAFEVSQLIAGRTEHTLAVEVGCAPPLDRASKRALTGVFQHADDIDPNWNPGGIWRPVALTGTGPVRIARLRVLCGEATSERGRLDLRAVLDADEAQTVLLRVTVRRDGTTATERVSRHALARGDNRIELRITVDEPALWWPRALGDQPLYDLDVEVLTSPDADRPTRRTRRDDTEVTVEDIRGHIPSDIRHVRTGVRHVAMHNWIVTVNGERLFIKGTNLGPTRAALAAASAEEIEADVVLAADAGLDLLRLRGHVARPELYDAADRHGVLLWQDLPLQWGYARSVRRQAVRQAREAVDLLGHHPALALWCGHNEPFDPEPDRIRNWGRAVWQDRPTWNKTVLDGSVARALQRADPSRPVVPHTGTGPDSHLYVGWYHGEERDLPRLLGTVPRLARFVTEFGAQAVPTTAAWMHPERWPALDWDAIVGVQRDVFDRYVPPAAYVTFDAWRAATQEYQATLIRYHIETLRRLKYRPVGGFCQFSFADPAPAVSWSVLDHDRIPKAGYAALRAACAPVIVVVDRPLPSYELGAEVELDVHVVSDLRQPLRAVVRATLGDQRWGWAGDIDADACVRVGTIRGVAVPGDLVVTLAAGDVSYRSAYPIGITR